LQLSDIWFCLGEATLFDQVCLEKHRDTKVNTRQFDETGLIPRVCVCVCVYLMYNLKIKIYRIIILPLVFMVAKLGR
jgi:hypothetical protein